MNLLEEYKHKNKDPAWRDMFSSLAKNKQGRVFNHINTNFRTQNAFVTQFTEFEKVEGVARCDWETQSVGGQEFDKHRVVKMLEAKLFQRFKKNGEVAYRKTAKGVSYRKYIDKSFGENETWIINYLYLLNGNYGNETNHIIKKTQEILRSLRDVLGMEESVVLGFFDEVFSADKKDDLLVQDLFYVMSFFGDVGFLKMYFESSKEDKESLHAYIMDNLQNKNDACCISRKYKPGGNYSYSMAIDEMRVFCLTYLLLQIESRNPVYVFQGLLDNCENTFVFDKGRVLHYLNEEVEIFDLILSEALEVETEDAVVEIEIDAVEDDGLVPYIDTTTKRGKREADRIFAIKKGKARKMFGYRCSLETSRDCQNHYFISKTTNKNYIEVHHLIPREYSNRFDRSLEVVPNYITLCPNCHQLLHKAVDAERKDYIVGLLNERKDDLSALDLEIEKDELLEFYRIEN